MINFGLVELIGRGRGSFENKSYDAWFDIFMLNGTNFCQLTGSGT